MQTSATMSNPLPTGAGFVDPNFQKPHGPHDARIVIYGYTPNFALCILAIALFALSFTLHIFHILRYRTWYFLPLSLACLMEVVGYIFRSFSSRKDPYNIIYFVVEYFFIVVAPVLVSASIYVCLSKLIRWAESEGFDTTSRRYLNPRGIMWGFITCDIIATIVQIAGAASIGTAESKLKSAKIPNDILLAGLAFQTFAFLVFLALLGIFTVSLDRDPGFRPRLGGKVLFFHALAASSLLVFLRTTFRLAETAQGVFGYLRRHEAFFGALEFMPMVIAVWILVIWHPGRWIPRIKRASAESGTWSPPAEKKTRDRSHSRGRKSKTVTIGVGMLNR